MTTQPKKHAKKQTPDPFSSVVNIALDPGTAAFVDARTEVTGDARYTHGRGPAIRNLLQDYAGLLAHTLRDLRRRELFSRDECAVILDALNGTMHTPGIIGELAIGVEDAISLDGLTGTATLPVEWESLVAKLQNLTAAEELAILDAAARWWKRTAETPAGQDQPDYGELLR